MIVAQVPWFAVEQGATVVIDGRPRTVTDAWKLGMVVVDGIDWFDFAGDGMATVLVPETDDAIRILRGQFTVDILEGK